MESIGIVTDSAAGLPRELIAEHGIEVVPMTVRVGDRCYREGIDIGPADFYRMMDGKTFPATSSPPPGEFLQVYKRLAEKATQIISIHITSKGSGTYQTALLASRSVPKVDITVYDSGTVSMGTGFLALEAARAAKNGLKVEHIVKRLDSIKDRIRAFAAIPTLEYLRRSGRVEQGQALLASILSIKPVVEIAGGLAQVRDRVRTFPRAVSRMIDLAVEAAGTVPSKVAVMHANCLDEAERIASILKSRLHTTEVIIGEVGSALAVHGGPGMVGIIVCPDKL